MADALYTIALRIEQAWPERPAAAKSYLAALRCMVSADDHVGTLTGGMAVRQFLALARGWNTPRAEDLKRQLSDSVAAAPPAPPLTTLDQETCPVCQSRLKDIGAAVGITHLNGQHLLMCAVCAHLTGTGEPSAVYRHGPGGWARLDQMSDR